MNDKLVFSSELEEARPSQVIFYILERAMREEHFGIEGGQMFHYLDVEDQIDEYIERLVKRGAATPNNIEPSNGDNSGVGKPTERN